MSYIESFLTSKEEQEIIEAIRLAELNTSGEIRIHLEDCCIKDVEARALEVFSILKMDNTRQKNAVLIYVAVHDHAFVIYGDEGINKVVSNDFWDTTRDTIQTHFKNGQYAKGLIDGVANVGKQLKTFFPWNPNDSNELPNSISKS